MYGGFEVSRITSRDFLIRDSRRIGDLLVGARASFEKNKDVIKNKELLVIIDYSQPSYKKRFLIYNLVQGKFIRAHHVAHGINSNNRVPVDKSISTNFSNKINSRQTSLGSFVTKSTYYGKNGRSLNLKGLDKTNNNAFIRRIVIHKARYVTDGYILRHGRTGNSWGCPALDPAVCQDVIDLIKNGTLIYATD